MGHKRVITVRIDDKVYEKVKIISEMSKRSINSQFEFIVEEFVMGFEKEKGKIDLPEEDA